jgi:hypothetical protein
VAEFGGLDPNLILPDILQLFSGGTTTDLTSALTGLF